MVSSIKKTTAGLLAILLSAYFFAVLFPNRLENLDPVLGLSVLIGVILLSVLVYILVTVILINNILEYTKTEGYEGELENYLKDLVVGISGGVIVLLINELRSITPSELLSLEWVVSLFGYAHYLLLGSIIISFVFLIYANIDIDG
jgi:hypothetical protein